MVITRDITSKTVFITISTFNWIEPINENNESVVSLDGLLRIIKIKTRFMFIIRHSKDCEFLTNICSFLNRKKNVEGDTFFDFIKNHHVLVALFSGFWFVFQRSSTRKQIWCMGMLIGQHRKLYNWVRSYKFWSCDSNGIFGRWDLEGRI